MGRKALSPFIIHPMFWNRNKIDTKMIPHIIPTSKVSLKMSCLQSCNGDLDKAEKLYAYLSEGIDDLPTFDPVRPTKFEQAKSIVGDGFNWVKENQETIVNWVAFFKDLFGKGGGGVPPASAAVPPING